MPKDAEHSTPAVPAFDGPHTIDAGLFVAYGNEVRSFVRTIEVDAPPGAVFAFWTDAEVWKRTYGRDEVGAKIDLAIGGRYEWYFVPASESTPPLGSNGCQILSYIPERMVSFTWNAPPTQPIAREKRTWVVVEIAPLDGGSRSVCSLTHLGFGEGGAWDETYDYFGEAWKRVLATMKSGLDRPPAS